MYYDYKKIEAKWQKYWEDNKTFKTNLYDFSKKKYYALDMFPYPSGVGLHAGHPEGYTATDIVSRMKRMQGFNVLHPMGFDSFGLPAEQYAIQTGNHPAVFTEQNINTFRKQLKMLGFSYDWDLEVSTSDPSYYKWTEWIFKKLYEDGYAKLIDMPVNWCEELGTVLANDEVIDGNVKPNLLNRNFATDALNKVWDTDVTYLIFKDSRAYLSTIIDLYDRKVVAYKISKHNDNKLVIDTLNEAIAKRKDVYGLILHSDQGFQYTSNEYKAICESNGITISMARKGTPIDDSPIESWHSLLKKETLYNNNITSLQEYIQLVEEWILFYNTTRLKSKVNKKRKTYTKREK